MSELELAIRIWEGFDDPQRIVDLSASFPNGSVEQFEAYMMAWSWMWAEDGFWTLTCGAKYAAAMMATNTAGARGGLLLPARAIKFMLPDGAVPGVKSVYLLGTKGMGLCLATGAKELSGQSAGYDGADFFSVQRSVEDVMFDADEDDFGDNPFGERIVPMSRDARTMTALRRLCVGLLYTMQHTKNFSIRDYPVRATSAGRLRHGAPTHRNVFVGKPIELDVRPQVERWLAGRSGGSVAPSLQHVVRGHYKRQVIGEARGSRKIIWVEPYWRGPEGAPILVHARSLEGG